MEKAGNPGALRIWALVGARAGDNNQVLALAEALGLPFEIKQLEYNALRVIGPRLLGASLASLAPASRDMILSEPAPDLTISAGHRSVAVVQFLRHCSGGQIRSIHLGFPRISPARFDLVVSTPEYPIADHDNLLRVPLPLTLSRRQAASAGELSHFPRPRRLLVIGGPTLFWRPTKGLLGEALDTLIAQARKDGGCVLAIGSPRTPSSLALAVRNRLEGSGVPHLLAPTRGEPSYASLLASADFVYVTADSVAMTSDAIATGKPVGLVPIEPTLDGRVAMAVMGVLAPGRRIYPRDPRFVWKGLRELGLVGSVEAPRAGAVPDVTGTVVKAALAVIDRGKDAVSKGKNGGRGKD